MWGWQGPQHSLGHALADKPWWLPDTGVGPSSTPSQWLLQGFLC